MRNTNGMKRMFWRRFFSGMIDLVFISCAGFLLHLIVMQWIFFDPFTEFTLCWILYYTLCYRFLQGQTLAKVITRLQVTGFQSITMTTRQIVIREVVCKFALLLLLPAWVIHRLPLYQKSQVWSAFIAILVILLIMLVSFLWNKRTWWEQASATKTIRYPESGRHLRLISVLALSAIFILTIFIKIAPSVRDLRLAGKRYFPEYPVNAETKRYAGYIKTHVQDPVEYVFGLFDKFDLVVLDERMHTEYTQYELYTKIVGDPRFAGKIGNIYTECGSQSYQDTLARYMHTVFPNEDTLNKATAWLENNSSALWPIWGHTNLFDLLKYVNKLNSTAPDSLKINWYGADIPMNWAKMTTAGFQQIPRLDKRDRSMADYILSVYKNKAGKQEKRKKGLVIMNHRHGFGLIRDSKGRKTNHFLNKNCTTAMLMDELPGKVCNVLINTVPFGVYSTFFGPVQSGKWDKAFELAGNPEMGFNFNGSPFGLDNFDEYLWNSSSELQYQDVFTGFIFYKPLEQHVQKVGYPDILYHFKDTLLRRSACLGESYQATIKNETLNLFKNDSVTAWETPYAAYYNWIANIGFSLVITLTLVVCFVFYKQR